jgi:hypothetical protein
MLNQDTDVSTDKKYYISLMVEQHNHTLISPDKTHLLRSNRLVNHRVTNTLFYMPHGECGYIPSI